MFGDITTEMIQKELRNGESSNYWNRVWGGNGTLSLIIIKINFIIHLQIKEGMLIHPFIHHIDSPNKEILINSFSFRVRGWIATKVKMDIIEIILKTSNQLIYLNIVERPDVNNVYEDYFPIGFEEIFSILLFPDPCHNCELIFKFSDEEFSVPINFNFLPGLYKKAKTIKAMKLDKIFPILQCPKCNSNSFLKYEKFIQCGNCYSQYSIESNCYNFLTDDLKLIGGVKSTGNVSANYYDPYLMDIIVKNKEKLILDNGAGLRDKWYKNVVNFEIASYPSTDVMGIGEILPFKTGSFDFVFSLAVLEHVKNPFLCAEEILRVLKPGGILVIIVPFLEPYHGYPDHYYNMTSNGLKNLFDGKIKIIDCFVPKPGLPIYSLTWIIRLYLDGLSGEIAEKFKKMKIEDFLQDAIHYVNEPFVTELNPATNELIACTNYLIGQKK
jgi:SAM-dependent methyltransferase